MASYLGLAPEGSPNRYVAPPYYDADGQQKTLSNEGLVFTTESDVLYPDSGIIPQYACVQGRARRGCELLKAEKHWHQRDKSTESPVYLNRFRFERCSSSSLERVSDQWMQPIPRTLAQCLVQTAPPPVPFQ